MSWHISLEVAASGGSRHFGEHDMGRGEAGVALGTTYPSIPIRRWRSWKRGLSRKVGEPFLQIIIRGPHPRAPFRHSSRLDYRNSHQEIVAFNQQQFRSQFPKFRSRSGHHRFILAQEAPWRFSQNHEVHEQNSYSRASSMNALRAPVT